MRPTPAIGTRLRRRRRRTLELEINERPRLDLRCADGHDDRGNQSIAARDRGQLAALEPRAYEVEVPINPLGENQTCDQRPEDRRGYDSCVDDAGNAVE